MYRLDQVREFENNMEKRLTDLEGRTEKYLYTTKRRALRNFRSAPSFMAWVWPDKASSRAGGRQMAGISEEMSDNLMNSDLRDQIAQVGGDLNLDPDRYVTAAQVAALLRQAHEDHVASMGYMLERFADVEAQMHKINLNVKEFNTNLREVAETSQKKQQQASNAVDEVNRKV